MVKSRYLQKFLNTKANSVGYINIKDIGGGTGFAVGQKYIMSAYHVFKDTIGKYIVFKKSFARL